MLLPFITASTVKIGAAMATRSEDSLTLCGPSLVRANPAEIFWVPVSRCVSSEEVEPALRGNLPTKPRDENQHIYLVTRKQHINSKKPFTEATQICERVASKSALTAWEDKAIKEIKLMRSAVQVKEKKKKTCRKKQKNQTCLQTENPAGKQSQVRGN